MQLEHGIPGRQYYQGGKGGEKEEGRGIFDQKPHHHESIKTGKSEEAKADSTVHWTEDIFVNQRISWSDNFGKH